VKIPVFVSCPTSLSAVQETARKVILRELDRANLEPRALGRSDYPTELPLREVLLLAKHCSGGVILGFEQIQVLAGVAKRGTTGERRIRARTPLPTPWNQLEAGILFGLSLPLLVFADEGISGGVFDPGVTDVFIHRMPAPTMPSSARKALAAVFQKWQAAVRSHYYQ
jgi:hypothetical protein